MPHKQLIIFHLMACKISIHTRTLQFCIITTLKMSLLVQGLREERVFLFIFLPYNVLCKILLEVCCKGFDTLCTLIQSVWKFLLQTSRACRGDWVDNFLNRNPCPKHTIFVLQVQWVQIKCLNFLLLSVIEW